MLGLAMDIDDYKFIANIKRKKILWISRSCPNINTRNIRAKQKQAWRELCAKLDHRFREFSEKEKENAVNEARKRWKRIRDRHAKGVIKVKAGKKPPDQKLLKMMKFLSSSKRINTSIRNIPDANGGAHFRDSRDEVAIASISSIGANKNDPKSQEFPRIVKVKSISEINQLGLTPPKANNLSVAHTGDRGPLSNGVAQYSHAEMTTVLEDSVTTSRSTSNGILTCKSSDKGEQKSQPCAVIQKVNGVQDVTQVTAVARSCNLNSIANASDGSSSYTSKNHDSIEIEESVLVAKNESGLQEADERMDELPPIKEEQSESDDVDPIILTSDDDNDKDDADMNFSLLVASELKKIPEGKKKEKLKFQFRKLLIEAQK